MSIDVNNIADGYDIGKQLLEAYQTADDKEKFLDELDSLKGSGAISNYNRDTFRAYANKGITPNGNISVISNARSTKDLTELYEKPITDRQDELHNMVQKGFDDTQELVQREFDETQDNLNTNTNKIINNDNANFAVATAKWDKIISILTVLGTSPLTEEDMAEVLAAS